MSEPTYLIAVASWEERFVLGFERDLDHLDVKNVVVFYYAEYDKITFENRLKIQARCKADSISYKELSLSFLEPIPSWKKLNELFLNSYWEKCAVYFDISTAPREAIWNILFLLDRQNASVEYVYHKPTGYADWLSREPGTPRLIYRQSGLMRLGLPTCLVIITGFDSERTLQLVNYYEPKHTVIGFQPGEQFENEKENVKKHLEALSAYADYSIFEIDAYTLDHGFSVLKNEISSKLKSYNVLATSLGPKPTSIALYKARREMPSIGLVYTPSYEFNINYSVGIGSTISGTL